MLVKVKHRYMRQDNERGGLRGPGVRQAEDECWVNPAHVVVVVTEGDWFTIRLVVGNSVTVDRADLDAVIAVANGASQPPAP